MVVEALKDSIKDPSVAIAAIKKRDPLVDETTERGRLDLVIKNAIATDTVRKNGLCTVDEARMLKTIKTVAAAFHIPEVDVKSIYKPDYLPPQAERQLR